MKTYLLFLVFSFSGFLHGIVEAPENGTKPHSQVQFYKGGFDSAQSKAAAEGKLFFVDFYADWCTPCIWMDKTTFRDRLVVNAINKDFVALKVDIESEEGYKLKNRFDVTILPTILIFNSQGQLVERIEKTVSADGMKSLLKFHNNPRNKIVRTHKVNTRPGTTVKEKEIQQSDTEISDMYKRYQTLEKFRTNYKLQIGSYYNHESAFDKVNDLKKDFLEPIIVLTDYFDNATQYKVLMGEFQTLEEAESFRKILQRDFQIESIVY